jgi:hypothetical protein
MNEWQTHGISRLKGKIIYIFLRIWWGERHVVA